MSETRMAWTSVEGRIDEHARFGRILSRARIARLANPSWVHDSNSTHHVAVVKRRWRTRFYLDGKRVRRWHPYLRGLRRHSLTREMLGL